MKTLRFKPYTCIGLAGLQFLHCTANEGQGTLTGDAATVSVSTAPPGRTGTTMQGADAAQGAGATQSAPTTSAPTDAAGGSNWMGRDAAVTSGAVPNGTVALQDAAGAGDAGSVTGPSEGGARDASGAARECDDGNATDGDGCSSTGAIEPGFTCSNTPQCGDDTCSMTVTAIHRDFDADDVDFGLESSETACGGHGGIEPVAGLVERTLDADGRPQGAGRLQDACISSAESFARWFRQGEQLRQELRLFDNGQGGYVNRFGEHGEQLVRTVQTDAERIVPSATGPDQCEPGCATLAALQFNCADDCRPARDSVLAAQQSQLLLTDTYAEVSAELELLQAEPIPDPDAVALLQAELEELQTQLDAVSAEIETFTNAAEQCDTTCQASAAAEVTSCVADCKPCSFNAGMWCIGGAYAYFDGHPAFFPVDSLPAPASDLSRAKLPEQYGYLGWPWEDEIYANAPEHNFFFTSELQYQFRFDAQASIPLAYSSDDDMWVFINDQLLVDLGGLHVPAEATFILDAAAGTALGLQHGSVYRLSIFRAERMLDGSSWKITVPGSQSGPSVCTRNP